MMSDHRARGLIRVWTARYLDELQVCERAHAEVGGVVRRGGAGELCVTAADGERLCGVCAGQRGRAVQTAEVGWRAEL